MKKLILLFSVLTLTFTSCSSDDDSSNSQDPFIGTWKYHMQFIDGVEVSLDVCAEEDTFQVLSNGNYISKFHDEDANGVCVEDGNSTGTWENIGDGFYSTTPTGGTAVVEEIHFSGDTFYYEETDNNIVYKTVFKRQ